MNMRRKTFIISLAAVICLLFGTVAHGATASRYALKNTDTKPLPQVLGLTIRSSEFPSAYIVTNTIGAKPGKKVTATATVFVEETHKKIGNKVIVTSSRLLSEKEVKRIGVEKFDSLQNQYSAMATKEATNKNYKLKITFSGTYSTSGNSVTCNLKGNATWSGFNLIYTPSENPAVGDDFLGFTWAGKFEGKNHGITAKLNTGGTTPANLAKATPNVGRVWSFKECLNTESMLVYVKNVDAKITLSKAKKTGNSNKAEAVMTYIHTYQSKTGSINIGSGGAGFTLGNTSKQWSIACVVSGIPY